MNPLLLPPRLLFRALDDLHTLALAAARLERVEESLNARADAILAMGDRIDGRTEAIIEMGDRILELGVRMDDRAEAVIEMGAQIAALGERIASLGERMDARSEAILEQGDAVIAAAREVADRGAELAAALPVMQRAIEMAEPLEGVVERLGRVADRLPGGAARGGRSRAAG